MEENREQPEGKPWMPRQGPLFPILPDSNPRAEAPGPRVAQVEGESRGILVLGAASHQQGQKPVVKEIEKIAPYGSGPGSPSPPVLRSGQEAERPFR